MIEKPPSSASTGEAHISAAITLSAPFPLWIDYASKRPNIVSETLRKYHNDYKRFIADSDLVKMIGYKAM